MGVFALPPASVHEQFATSPKTRQGPTLMSTPPGCPEPTGYCNTRFDACVSGKKNTETIKFDSADSETVTPALSHIPKSTKFRNATLQHQNHSCCQNLLANGQFFRPKLVRRNGVFAFIFSNKKTLPNTRHQRCFFFFFGNLACHKACLPSLLQARGGAGDGNGSAQKHNEKDPARPPTFEAEVACRRHAFAMITCCFMRQSHYNANPSKHKASALLLFLAIWRVTRPV